MLDLLAAGEAHRHFGETKMNVNSSRSHTLFRMVCGSPVKPFCTGPVKRSVPYPVPQLRCNRQAGSNARVSSMTDLAYDTLERCTQLFVAPYQVVESRAREQSADEHDSGAVWVSALTLVDLAGRSCPATGEPVEY